jgi:isopenicillin-N epimerase
VTFLNHGSFGACPRVVLDAQQDWRERMERQPVEFFSRDLEEALDEARAAVAAFVSAPSSELAFVANATTGVNAVLRSLTFEPGDELLVTSHGYNACRNALDFVAQRHGARVVVVDLPFPIESSDVVTERIVAAVTERTRLALVDHITSPTGLVLPIARIVAALEERGVDTLVDGAHAPGHVPLDVSAIGAAYYTGNCHKWLFAPKSVGFLHVRNDKLREVRPTVISHGANARRDDRSRFLLEFDWVGTTDPTAALAVTDGLRFGERLFEGGWKALMAKNRAGALAARARLAEAVGTELPCPDEMVGALASVLLPDRRAALPSAGAAAPAPATDPLYDALLAGWKIEVPIVSFPAPPRRHVRISSQAYNTPAHYERLAVALTELLAVA